MTEINSEYNAAINLNPAFRHTDGSRFPHLGSVELAHMDIDLFTPMTRLLCEIANLGALTPPGYQISHGDQIITARVENTLDLTDLYSMTIEIDMMPLSRHGQVITVSSNHACELSALMFSAIFHELMTFGDRLCIPMMLDSLPQRDLETVIDEAREMMRFSNPLHVMQTQVRHDERRTTIGRGSEPDSTGTIEVSTEGTWLVCVTERRSLMAKTAPSERLITQARRVAEDHDTIKWAMRRLRLS